MARISSDNLDERFLQDACPAFTSVWLVHTLERLHEPLPEMVNRDGEALIFTTNSLERAKHAKEVLEALLHGLIGPALSKLQTPEQLMAENETRQQGDNNRQSVDSIDPEIAAEIIQSTMDQHYRQCLDEPIPALDNKTPRQCARSKKVREKSSSG